LFISLHSYFMTGSCSTVNPQVRGVEYCFFIYVCSSNARRWALGILYGYKVLLQAITVIMALKTRRVKVRGVDDYQEIIMATYFTSFCAGNYPHCQLHCGGHDQHFHQHYKSQLLHWGHCNHPAGFCAQGNQQPSDIEVYLFFACICEV